MKSVGQAGSEHSKDGVATAIAILRQRFGDRLQTGEAIRRQHANTITWIPNQPPDAVVWVQDQDEVCEVVRVARTHRVPIIPYGAGTSLEGHINAPRGGLSVDFSNMNRVLAVNERDLDCVVEPGVSRKQLNEFLRDSGLFFPVDPGAEEATIGGMAATRASGTNAVRYGTMRENVLNLTAIMPDGSVVKTAQRARKSSAGYDLTRLLVGSEGTLGIITQITLRLYGIPERILAAVCPFATLEGACNAVIQSIQLGLGVARMELLDPAQIRAVNIYSKLSLEEKPTLFLEFHGTEAGARDQVEQFKAIAESEGALRFDWAETEEERRRLWKARHDVYWAVKTVWPGKDALATDVCVPISRLAECVMETHKDIEASGLTAPLAGHAGDGNFHTSVVFDRNDPKELAAVEGYLKRLAERAIRMEGTCTGEHGVGQGKSKYLKAELGDGLAVMRAIKAALDPHDLFNPGKILPA
ncbi:MAG TPA: FAD-linked oxidase C-terminal domain-containing protein [Hyphomicrobiaceae bacterium]|nr:FAD-linked oxidase C-terminal domain-containing protein [Hyphomicrobiaceae bacterium]